MPGSRGQTPASTSSGLSTSRTSATLNDHGVNIASPRRSGDGRDDRDSRGSARQRRRPEGSAGGFLLDSLTARIRSSPGSRRYGSLKGKSKAREETVGTTERHTIYGFTQGEGLSQPTDRDGSSAGDAGSRTQSSSGTPDRAERPVPHSPYLSQSRRHQPTELVNIALQLNQTRQRQASARLHPQLGGAGLPGRTVSTSSAKPLSSGFGPEPHRNSAYGERNLPSDPGMIQSDQAVSEGLADAGEGPDKDFYPSPQTIIRTERAKIALELKYHHRRMLQHLPQLPAPKPSGSPGMAHIDGDEVQQVAFGRTYNPLQYARNRRIRLQKRSPLKPERDGWDDLDRVTTWVNEVAAQRDVHISSLYDNYPLPQFGLTGSQVLESSRATLEDAGRPKPGTRLPLPPNDWTITGPELLADTYWLQENGNRHLIEDRHHDRLFPAPSRLRTTSDNRRRSVSNSKGRSNSNTRQSVESKRGPTSNFAAENAADRSFSPKRLLESAIKRSPKPSNRRRTILDRSPGRTSCTASDSTSGDEQQGHRKSVKPWSKTFGKQWEDRIPERASMEAANGKDYERGRQSLEVTNARLSYESRPVSIELQPPEEDKEPALLRQDTFSDLDSTAPNSPVQAPTVPSFAVDFDSRKIFGSPPAKRSKTRKRSPADHHHGIQQRDFADDPFQEDGDRKHFFRNPGRGHISTLSNASETSISAASDKRHFRRSDTERGTRSPDDGTSFRLPKPWRAGKYMAGRVGDLLRRKDYASDTSETDDESRQKNLRDQISRTSTISSTGRGNLSRSSTLSGAGEGPGYRPPEFPHFSPLRREGPTGSPSRLNTNDSILQRISRDTDASKFLSPVSAEIKSPARSLTPQLKRIATGEGKESSDMSRQPSTPGTGRRGAFFTDTSGQQWPQTNRSTALAWPGEDETESGKKIWCGPELKPSKDNVVTQADIFRTETVLKSSCIKATKVAEVFRAPRADSKSLLHEIRSQYDPKQAPVARHTELDVLSQHLIKQVDTDIGALSRAVESFLTKDVGQLEKRLDGIQSVVHDKLTVMVLSAGESADALGNEISAGLTREVRDLNDSIDQLVRARRRRGRWLRHTAWRLLEFVTVSLMYVVWLCWTLFKLVRGSLRFFIAIARWLFLL